MKAVPHDNGIAHERIASAAQAMLNKSEEERSGILSTALAFLGLYSDPDRGAEHRGQRLSDPRSDAGRAPDEPLHRGAGFGSAAS